MKTPMEYSSGSHFYGDTRNTPERSDLAEQGLKPPTQYYHYSNEHSQNALITQTRGYPSKREQAQYIDHSAYSDRLAGWDYDHFKQLCKMIGGGDQAWAYKLQGLKDPELLKIAQFAFNLPELPAHARFIHCFNVSSGYSCPVIVALVKK